jgi:hypothetical protein
VHRSDVKTWIIYDVNTPIGYVELEYIGETLNKDIGQGPGAHALTLTPMRAWELNPKRVTLNTC